MNLIFSLVLAFCCGFLPSVYTNESLVSQSYEKYSEMFGGAFTVWNSFRDFKKKYDTYNENALAAYRLGLAIGDSDIITKMATDSFNFTWVPDSVVMNKEEYVQFLGKFKEEAEKDGRPKFLMRFNNLIQRKVDDTIIEAADWIVDGYDRGVYMHAVQGGRIIWDMATNS
eukprot:GFUD01133039.1.p1 GENE.GFUD01133039.1~~GFUD01133039.1.p1  ORF type:complete len:170 (+),score=33.88 GFUD01133039.1:56-565(+)